MKNIASILLAALLVMGPADLYAQCATCNQTPNTSAPSVPNTPSTPATPATPSPVVTHIPAPLMPTTTAVRFDWETQWGKINFAGTTDPGIPSDQYQPKGDIKRVISSSGTQTTDLSSLRVYGIDLNTDGKEDIVIDGNGYFPQYFNASTAPVTICTATDGCYMTIYMTGENTALISEPPANSPACPATAALNTTCQSNCAATAQNCPALFRYNTRTVFNEQVFSWSFMQAVEFQTWATGKPYGLANTNPVFVAKRNPNKCYNDEMSYNNNECVKYYQFVGSYASGSLVDLYNYQDTTNGNFNSRFTYHSFDLATSHGGRGMALGNGFGHELSAGSSVDLQLTNFNLIDVNGVQTPGDLTEFAVLAHPGFASFHIENHSSNSYFVPMNTDREFCSFLNSHQTGVTVTHETLQFTAWTGELTCPTNLTAPETIAAQRFCQSSTSDYRPCQACIDAKVPGWEQGCKVSQSCPANTCVFNEAAADPYIGGYVRQYNGINVSEADCSIYTSPSTVTSGSPPDAPLWVAFYNLGEIGAYGGCGGTFQHLCQGGNFCFAADTEIALPDGTTKHIDQIKAGDMVLGFKKTKDTLKPYKVKTVTVTPEQNLLDINGQLQLTPNHEVVNAKGAKIRASSLKVGDVLLRGDGSKLKIETVKTVPAKSTVYNLKLEDSGAGFVAGGVRVTVYR